MEYGREALLLLPGISNSSTTMCSPVEVKKAIPDVGDSKVFSPMTILVDEVGDSSDWIFALGILGVLWLGV